MTEWPTRDDEHTVGMDPVRRPPFRRDQSPDRTWLVGVGMTLAVRGVVDAPMKYVFYTAYIVVMSVLAGGQLGNMLTCDAWLCGKAHPVVTPTPRIEYRTVIKWRTSPGLKHYLAIEKLCKKRSAA